MNFSRNSHSRGKLSKRKYQCISSVDLLHNGLRRKVSQNQYKSIYPRLKINQKSRVNTMTIFQNQFSQECVYDQVLNMRQQNRKLEQQNQTLRANIRRGNKLNDLFERRREHQDLQKMQFQKLVELKLLLQSQDLEQEESECQKRLKEAQKNHKNAIISLKNNNLQPQIVFIDLMTQLGFGVPQMKQKNEDKIANVNNRLFRTKIKTRKLKQLLKAKAQELKTLTEQIQIQKKKLPVKFDTNLNVSDSGLMSLQARNKPIDEIQNEIVRIKEETKKFEGNMQNQIDKHVLSKILLCKEIDQLKAKISEKNIKARRTSINW